ncbi:MAG: recombination regulator RecX [Treponema sp.]|jgi:regulatory protein|nr:recombination regulator RecX [Treponema sp.]
MTIVAIKSGSGVDVLRLELSDGSLFSFKACYLPAVFFDSPDQGQDSRYVPGAELSPDEEESFRFASACLRGEKAALRLVSRAEQTSLGLRRKLEKTGYPSACVQAVLARLEELEILDDSLYARMWLQSRVTRKAESPRRLLAGLRSRGISRQDAEAALREVLSPAAERTLMENFLRKNKLPGPGEKSNTGNILKWEGFSSALIREYRDNA